MNQGVGQALVGGVSLSPLKLTRAKYFGDCTPRSLELDGWEKGSRWRQSKAEQGDDRIRKIRQTPRMEVGQV